MILLLGMVFLDLERKLINIKKTRPANNLKKYKMKHILYRIMPGLRGLLKNNDQARSARSLFLRRPRSSGIVRFNEFLTEGHYLGY